MVERLKEIEDLLENSLMSDSELHRLMVERRGLLDKDIKYDGSDDSTYPEASVKLLEDYIRGLKPKIPVVPGDTKTTILVKPLGPDPLGIYGSDTLEVSPWDLETQNLHWLALHGIWRMWEAGASWTDILGISGYRWKAVIEVYSEGEWED